MAYFIQVTAMSTLLLVVGFAAQCLVIAFLGAIIISSVYSSSTDSALISKDHPLGAELSVNINNSAAMLPIASNYFAKSMVSSSYTTTIDETIPTTDDYSILTIRQLKALCKDRRIKGYSSLRKHELVALLSDVKPRNEFSNIIAGAISEVMDDFYHDQW